MVLTCKVFRETLLFHCKSKRLARQLLRGVRNSLPQQVFKNKLDTALSRTVLCLKSALKRGQNQATNRGSLKVLFYCLNSGKSRAQFSIEFTSVLCHLYFYPHIGLRWESCPLWNMFFVELRLLRYKKRRSEGRGHPSGWSRPITICLVVERHELYPMEPEEEGAGVGWVDAGGSRIRPQQLAGSVLDQFLRIPATQTFGGIFIQRGDVVAFGSSNDRAEGRGWVDRGRRVLPGLSHSFTGI